VFKADVRARRTGAPGIRLVPMAILLVVASIAAVPSAGAAPPGGTADPSLIPAIGDTPLDRQGMWIWYVSSSDGGVPSRMISRAARFGIGTVYIKAGDGGGAWSQFSPSLVQALHQGGLDVCAWQFVYGDHPLAEARVGAAAVSKGADCLVIDAEGQYEGKYASADRYIRALRARIGAAYPLSLAGFPYVDFHPAFPYSVFLGEGGAQYNQPQMYWKAIGTSVRAVYEHTYLFNRLWDRPIYPLGQTYDRPGRRPVKLFRRFAASYGGAPSWWDWQETGSREWGALGSTAIEPVAGYRPIFSQPVLKRGSRGDLVVWAQEHLLGAGQAGLPVTGIFGKLTYAAVRAFQSTHVLPADGVIGASTWQALLNFSPIRPRWSGGSRRKASGGAGVSRALAPSRPLSASLPAKTYEIDPGPAP
jgi:Putative peptidoglycan binding domain